MGAARIVTSSSYDHDADAGCLLQRLRWKDLIVRRQIQEALMIVFKPINNLVPHYLSSMFTERIESGHAIKYSANKLEVPLPRTNYLKKSFSYRHLTLWNSVPCDVRRERSFNRFKQFSGKSIKLNTRHSWETGLFCGII